MDWEDKLLIDNKNATFLAEELASIPGIQIDASKIETNIVRFKIADKTLKRIKLDHDGVKIKLR